MLYIFFGLAVPGHTVLRLASFDVADDADGRQCVDADEAEEQDQKSIHLAKIQYLRLCKDMAFLCQHRAVIARTCLITH